MSCDTISRRPPLLPQDRCKTLFKQVYEEKRLKGRANDAIAAACLFIACRQEDVPRSFKEICAVSKHPKKEIGRCFKIIQQSIKTPVTPASTTDFMVREREPLSLLLWGFPSERWDFPFCGIFPFFPTLV